MRRLWRHAIVDLAILAAAVMLATGTVTAGEPKLGAHLMGKLEGPEIVREAARTPKQFKEAPAFAALVKAGKLPPVEKRLPEDVMVIKPVHEIGKYGGTWRRGFTGPADGENGNRIVSTDKILFWDYSGTKIAPCVAKDWNVGEDGKTITIYLRKGMRWSDGAPFTADDFLFWYRDIYGNKNLIPVPYPDLMIGGKPGTIEKVDAYTVAFRFPEANYLFAEILAGSTVIGGGQAARQSAGVAGGGYAPAHYLKQFHPAYVPKAELEAKVKAEGFDGWVSMFKGKMDWLRNPDLPVLTPWKTVNPINKPQWILERNPYYYAVDTEGNQLPYIDRIVMTQAENLELLNLRAIAGEYDLQERHTQMAKLPVFLENQSKGSYKVHLDPALNGCDSCLHINQSYEADPEVAKWLHHRDFRRALSLGIDRDQLNEAFWLGTGTPGSVAPAESVPESPGPEYRKRWSSYDLKLANQLLDQIGLSRKDVEGYRLRSDGKGRLRIEVQTSAGAFVPYTQHAEMIREQWKRIGIQADVKEIERNLAWKRTQNNEHQIQMWSNDGSELLFLFPRMALPVEPTQAFMGPLIARWYATGGAQGKKPQDPQMLKALELFRMAATLRAEERVKAAREIWRILVEEQYTIGLVGQSPAFMGVRVAKTSLGNVPARQLNAQHARTPGSSHPSTFFFK
jgi:peptide/nickel transport system substrate-binding protein